MHQLWNPISLHSIASPTVLNIDSRSRVHALLVLLHLPANVRMQGRLIYTLCTVCVCTLAYQHVCTCRLTYTMQTCSCTQGIHRYAGVTSGCSNYLRIVIITLPLLHICYTPEPGFSGCGSCHCCCYCECQSCFALCSLSSSLATSFVLVLADTVELISASVSADKIMSMSVHTMTLNSNSQHTLSLHRLCKHHAW